MSVAPRAAGFALLLGGLLFQDRAHAQASPKSANRSASEQLLTPEQTGSNAAAETARAQMRRGDCAGALEAFDSVLRMNVDPVLRRDRGLCHEHLGNPYPAIDDFRAYLTAVPDAPDAENIRARLARLEEQVGQRRSSSSETNPSNDVAVSTSASVRMGGDAKVDSRDADEGDPDTALRQGRGWLLGPVLGVRHWFDTGTSSSQWSEVLMVRVGYSFSRVSTVVFEGGYERFNTDSTDPVSMSGITTLAAYEARFPFGLKDVDNQMIGGVGFGFDHLSLHANNGITGISSPEFNVFSPRLRAGYRHNFASTVGLELMLDGGVAFITAADSDGTTSGLLGLNIALLFGL